MTESTITKRAEQSSWEPPTPTSSQIRFHSPPNLPVDHLVLLPPPLVPTHQGDSRRSSTISELAHPFYPTHILPPLSLPEPSLSTSYHVQDARREGTSSVSWEEEYTKRPRRSAAIAAARNIPRQPSPLELESDEDDDTSFSPPPLVPSTSSSTSSKSTAKDNAGGGGASKRKVSHSLIERRRREKINDCLATLRETVPSLKEEGARKIAKAKERGRKRGRDDAGERGGLHKLEILQGTIAYISDLRARIDELERLDRRIQGSPRSLDEGGTATERDSPTSIHSLRLMAASTMNSSASSSTGSTSISNSPEDVLPPMATMSKEEADHAASMLLYFSTSPELRPVQM
ncbi:uncharacterized protein JCM6883_002834 [Sporobolomyces salmoneus]|uniref:uncharacterized protein n=1 Tax=Sporobolomyces salmoneus TaxID=183962 RepID=UPI00317DE239